MKTYYMNATVYFPLPKEALSEGGSALQRARESAERSGQLVIVEGAKPRCYGVTPDGETVLVHWWWQARSLESSPERRE